MTSRLIMLAPIIIEMFINKNMISRVFEIINWFRKYSNPITVVIGFKKTGSQKYFWMIFLLYFLTPIKIHLRDEGDEIKKLGSMNFYIHFQYEIR